MRFFYYNCEYEVVNTSDHPIMMFSKSASSRLRSILDSLKTLVVVSQIKEIVGYISQIEGNWKPTCSQQNICYFLYLVHKISSRSQNMIKLTPIP